MPGNENSGAGIPFKMPEKELISAIEQYKKDLENGKFPRASWPHFCATLGYTEAEVKECMERGRERASAYYNRAVALKRMATWVRGQILSGSGWSGQVQSKAGMTPGAKRPGNRPTPQNRIFVAFVFAEKFEVLIRLMADANFFGQNGFCVCVARTNAGLAMRGQTAIAIAG